MTNRTLPTHAELLDGLRAELKHFDTDALNAQLDDLRRGPFSWASGTLEVEIICELKVRAANAKLRKEAHV